MKTVLPPESELAAFIIESLKADGCDVYQEVPFNGNYADIVWTRGPVIGVVETKKNLGLDVLEQCCDWLHYANVVYAGVWAPRRSQTRFGQRVAGKFGIGVLTVKHTSYNEGVTKIVNAEFRRSIIPGLRNALKPEHQTGEYGAAGTRGGGRFTPFKDTCEQLYRVVVDKPGIELKDAIRLITKHHYASDAAARVNLKDYIEDGVVKNIRHELDNRKFKLYPVIGQIAKPVS